MYSAPPKVMLGVNDEIRAEIKSIKVELGNYRGNTVEKYCIILLHFSHIKYILLYLRD